MKTPIPNPGSDEARTTGCLCPIIDNGYGRGSMYSRPGDPVFIFREDCPVHTPEPAE